MQRWRLSLLGRDERGVTAIIYGLLLVPLLGFIGLSVDSARAFAVRQQLQNALDAAALVGGRYYGFADRDTRIQNYFNANWKGSVHNATATPLVITEVDATHELTVKAQATVKPIFVKFLGINNVTVGSEARVVDSSATLELALAIDTTWSMDTAIDGIKKIESARTASTQLLDILYAGQASDDRVFVSVVPFVQAVNAGSNYSSWLVTGSEAAVPWATGPYPQTGWRGCMFERLDGSGNPIYDTNDTPPGTQKFYPYYQYLAPTCTNWTANTAVSRWQCIYNPSNRYYYQVTTAGTTSGSAPTNTTLDNTFTNGTAQLKTWYRRWATGENFTGTGNYRANPNWFFYYDNRSTGTTTGANPPSNTSGTVTSGGIQWRHRGDVHEQITSSPGSQYGYGYNSGCGTPLVPLTNTRATAQTPITNMQPAANFYGTMTPIGLIWAWRTLSPNWQNLWSGVPATRPKAYNEDGNYKAIVIMTDGDNWVDDVPASECTFCNGSSSPYGTLRDGRMGSTTDHNIAETFLDTRLTTICANARAQGVMIYAVVFGLPAGSSPTKTAFQTCVGTDHPSRFFDASNGVDLQLAFQSIAVDLTQLRLSH